MAPPGRRVGAAQKLMGAGSLEQRGARVKAAAQSDRGAPRRRLLLGSAPGASAAQHADETQNRE
jgi:hypothetical protein